MKDVELKLEKANVGAHGTASISYAIGLPAAARADQ